MGHNKMTEKFHKEVRIYLRILYILFFLTLLMVLFEIAFELTIFSVLFEIGKYSCIVLGCFIFFRLWVTCEKALEQHDVLVDRLAEKEKKEDRSSLP